MTTIYELHNQKPSQHFVIQTPPNIEKLWEDQCIWDLGDSAWDAKGKLSIPEMPSNWNPRHQSRSVSQIKSILSQQEKKYNMLFDSLNHYLEIAGKFNSEIGKQFQNPDDEEELITFKKALTNFHELCEQDKDNQEPIQELVRKSFGTHGVQAVRELGAFLNSLHKAWLQFKSITKDDKRISLTEIFTIGLGIVPDVDRDAPFNFDSVGFPSPTSVRVLYFSLTNLEKEHTEMMQNSLVRQLKKEKEVILSV